MADKLLILYSPDRASGKAVYDCVDMRDGELMINSGVCNPGPKGKLAFAGGLDSLLPFLDLIRAVSTFGPAPLADLLNDYLKLLVTVLQSRAAQPDDSFFSALFLLLTRLPYSAVNSQTVQHLADIRFHIGESAKQQEQFFSSLMMSCDYWLNSDNLEVINEFWQFVKAIYQQSPVAFNRVFSI